MVGFGCGLGAVLLLLGCSSRAEEDSGAQGGLGGAGTSSGGAGSGTPGSGAFGGQPGGIDVNNQGGTTGPAPGGSAELCNGIDDDLNGIIDDLDAAGDGVCDCLSIGTLGIAGTWGEGDVFDTWLDARASSGAVDLGSQVLTAELLAPFQIIVAQNLYQNDHTYSEAEVAALRAWIEAGGGFITLIGFADANERTQVNALLAPFGVSYGSSQILQKGGDASTVPVTTFYPHPTTENITRVGVDNGYPVEGAGTVVAAEGGYDVARAVEAGAGRIFVWGDEWITYNSEWTEHPDYQVERFWLNVLKWVTPTLECQVPLPPWDPPA
jgi:hypothetical protein